MEQGAIHQRHRCAPSVAGDKTLNGLKREVAGRALRHAGWMDAANGCQQPMHGGDFSNEMAWCHSPVLSRPPHTACMRACMCACEALGVGSREI